MSENEVLELKINRNNKFKKRIIFSVIAIVLLVITVGYALLGSNLDISGNISTKSNSWSVYLDNPRTHDHQTNVTLKEGPTIGDDGLTLSFSANLDKPGDSVQIVADIVNAGTIDVEIASVEVIPAELPSFISSWYSLLYEDEDRNYIVQSNEIVMAGESLPFSFFVSYSTDLIEADLTGENTTIDFSVKLTLRQAFEREYTCTYKDGTSDSVKAIGSTVEFGQYTYRLFDNNNPEYGYPVNAWSVALTDYDSTDPITSKLCQSINGFPIYNMSHMFHGSKATSVDLSSFDTSNVIDMSYMFAQSELTHIDVSKLDTSNVIDMSGMFGFTKSDTLDFSNFDTSKINNMSNMFNSCETQNLDLSNFDTSNVVGMYGMFAYVSATNLNISNFDTSNVVNMSGMFVESSVNEVNLSSFDTSNVTDMSYMFYGCNIPDINLSNFNTSKVNDFSFMFASGTFNNLDLTSFDIRSATNVQAMFQDTTVNNLNVSSFDTSNIEDMTFMFRRINTKKLDLSNFYTPKVTNISNMFYNSKIEELDISNMDLSKVKFSSPTFQGSVDPIKKIYVKDEATATIVKRKGSQSFNLPSACEVIIKQ